MGAENLKSGNTREEPRPSEFTSIAEYLRELYGFRKEADSEYSYTKMAEDLGYTASTIIYQYISGKRKITANAAGKIAKNIELNKSERQYLQNLIKYEACQNLNEKTKLYERLLQLKWRGRRDNQQEKDKLSYFSAWYHTALKELLALPGISQDPQTLADLMEPKLTVHQVRRSLQLLERLEVIRWDVGKNRYVVIEEQSSSGRAPQDYHLIKYHQEMAILASNAVAEINSNERDITSATVRLSSQQFHELKQNIYDFLTTTLKHEAEPEHTEKVYQLNVQLFPLTTKLDED